jgi:hypothetical protein
MKIRALLLAASLLAAGAFSAHAQIVWSVPNAGTTGTTVGSLAKLTGAPSTAVIAATTDISGQFGVVTGETGASAITGNALIVVFGPATCTFDNATTAGDHFTISSSTAGDCHDTGSGTAPTTSQDIGKVTVTNASAGSDAVFVFSPGINLGSLLTGTNIFSGSNTFGQVQGKSTIQSGTTYTFAATDCGTTVIFTSSSAVTATIPASIVPASGTTCVISVLQSGSAKVSVNGSAVTPATLISSHLYTGTSGTAGSIIGLELTTISSATDAYLAGDGS